MGDDVYTTDESQLVEAWFADEPIALEKQDPLAEWRYDHDPCDRNSRLDAWVGAFAVQYI